MRQTRILVVTLMHRVYGPAVASWLKACQAAETAVPGLRVDQLQIWGHPPGMVDGHTIVTAKYLEAQERFLSGDWWALVAIEDDMVIPLDTLPRLLALLSGGAHLGYGLYAWRHGTAHWSAYTTVEAHYGRSLSRDPEQARAAWGQVIDVAGVGMGCTAIRREVLEAVRFRRGGEACNDWYLAMDAQAHGWVQRCDLGLVCGHLALDPSPRILYPDPAQPDLVRTEFL